MALIVRQQKRLCGNLHSRSARCESKYCILSGMFIGRLEHVKAKPVFFESLMAEYLEQASQLHEMYCLDLQVMSSNPGRVGWNLGCIVFLSIAQVQ